MFPGADGLDGSSLKLTLGRGACFCAQCVLQQATSQVLPERGRTIVGEPKL